MHRRGRGERGLCTERAEGGFNHGGRKSGAEEEGDRVKSWTTSLASLSLSLSLPFQPRLREGAPDLFPKKGEKMTGRDKATSSSYLASYILVRCSTRYVVTRT